MTRLCRDATWDLPCKRADHRGVYQFVGVSAGGRILADSAEGGEAPLHSVLQIGTLGGSVGGRHATGVNAR
jgi:hypothetical protein